MNRINKGYLILFASLLILVSVFIIILVVNLFRPNSSNQNIFPTPTPVPQTGGRNGTGSTNTGEDIEPPLNPTEQQQLLKIRQEADQAYQDRKQRLPFITQLPYITTHFRIDIMSTSDTVTITTYGDPNLDEQYRSEALQWLRANGGNPDTLTLKYQHQS